MQDAGLEIGRIRKTEERREVVHVVLVKPNTGSATNEIQRSLGRGSSRRSRRIEQIVYTAGNTEQVLKPGQLNRDAIRHRRHAEELPAHAKI